VSAEKVFFTVYSLALQGEYYRYIMGKYRAFCLVATSHGGISRIYTAMIFLKDVGEEIQLFI
jgi:hypothetical protein